MSYIILLFFCARLPSDHSAQCSGFAGMLCETQARRLCGVQTSQAPEEPLSNSFFTLPNERELQSAACINAIQRLFSHGFELAFDWWQSCYVLNDHACGASYLSDKGRRLQVVVEPETCECRTNPQIERQRMPATWRSLLVVPR
jgi:hypothetical protein